MTKNNIATSMGIIVCLSWTSCIPHPYRGFDDLNKSITVGNWAYRLRVENQTQNLAAKGAASDYNYLKATLSIANDKTKKSLLYSASHDQKEYESHYKVLAFESANDLYLKYGDKIIYPIGYVFEPSNGLVPEERLVYKFAISTKQFKSIKESANQVAYWYKDHLIGLGKICFSAKN